MKNYNHEGRKMGHIIEAYNESYNYNIFDAYNNPSDYKQDAFYEIEARMKRQGGYGLKVVGACKTNFSTVYRVGRFYVYDTAADTYYIDGETKRASYTEGKTYAERETIAENKKQDTEKLKNISFMGDSVDYMEKEHGQLFFIRPFKERREYYFRKYARAYLLDEMAGEDGAEMFLQSLEPEIFVKSYWISDITEADWLDCLEDILDKIEAERATEEADLEFGNIYVY